MRTPKVNSPKLSQLKEFPILSFGQWPPCDRITGFNFQRNEWPAKLHQ